MKHLRLLLAAGACFATAAAVSAQSRPDVPVRQPEPNAYEQARNTYVNAAEVQVQAYHRQLDSTAKSAAPEEARFAESRRQLKDLDQLLVRLRSAAPAEFDAVKSIFERTRAALDQSLAR